MKLIRRALRSRNFRLSLGSAFLFFFGGLFLWGASLRVPDLSDLATRRVVQSTKIFDRTGQVLLYDMAQNVRRTIVPFEDISPYIKNATLAIEDRNFYNHGGVDLSSLTRAVLVNLTTLSFSQGGSTITQQVVKNSILTRDKTITRKIKEWILAVKLEKVLTKDQILHLYLNEIPYGGSIYGVEEAAESFFGKSAKEVGLAEAAYLAAMENAPTYYSPYGSHRDRLEERKNLVLKEMSNANLISQEEYLRAIKEEVVFNLKESVGGIRAPHFVFFVIDYLSERYGEEALSLGGLRVITTLDYDIQAEAEALAKQYGESNQERFNADNNAIVVIDPKTGGILSMVGSRNYFDETIDGNFNVTTAHRQPGSTFKPFVYSNLFNKGYTPETILFDVPTQFNPSCPPDKTENDPTRRDACYAPVNYDDNNRGPMRVRDALAQSINIPAVKALYLAGIQSSLDLAKEMGIGDLAKANQYGLSLVLGGGEVSLLDMTSAYSVFANDGMRNPYNTVLEVTDANGQALEAFSPLPRRVLDEETARKISSILSDNVARTPAYGTNSVLYVPGRDVAVKTGTTNDFKDAWIIGYTPNIAVGVWVGNNNNTPMEKRVAGFIVAPIWRDLMNKILPTLATENFIPPTPEDAPLKPVLRGIWQGGATSSGLGPSNQATEVISGGIHTILYWVNKNDPRGPNPTNPESDPQFKNWEYAVRRWVTNQGLVDGFYSLPVATTSADYL